MERDGLVPASHLLSVGKPGTVALRAPNFAVQNCDLLLAIGARLDNVVTAYNPKKFARSAKKIVVDVDPAELAKFPDDFGIDRKIEADALDFIETCCAFAKGPYATSATGWRAAPNGSANIRSTRASPSPPAGTSAISI